MFDKEFYPTPPHLIQKMREKLQGFYKYVLEPSAGKGDIADAFIKECRTVHCIEKNSDLQAVLRNKKHTVIDDDFLTFTTDFSYDLVVMNPPFSNGDKHLLKAIEIVNDGEIVCILNSETLKNPHTERRALLTRLLETLNAKIDYIENGFVDAERKTTVGICIIYIDKRKGEEGSQNWFNNVDSERIFDFSNVDFKNNEIATRDIIQNTVDEYEKCKTLFFEMAKIKNELNTRIKRIIHHKSDKELPDLVIRALDNESKKEMFNSFVNEFRQSAWENIFKNTKFSELMTKGVKKQFMDFQKEQQVMSFTKKNIENLFINLWDGRQEIFDKSIQEVFDELTKFDKKNKVHIEGWKTNDAWRVNKKVIIPYAVELSWHGHFKLTYGYGWSRKEFIKDLENVLSRISGKKYTSVHDSIEKGNPEGSRNNVFFSTFFKIECFKKGTMHLTFLDDSIWHRFNATVAKLRGFPLPDNYKETSK